MTRLLALACLLAACGADDPGSDACTPVLAGDTWTGPGGSIVEIVMTNPTPPARFTNWWAVRITDPGGAPMIDPASLAVSAYMPEHDHLSPTTPTVTGEAEGLVVGPLELWMPGVWEIRFDVGGERIVVPVCIDE